MIRRAAAILAALATCAGGATAQAAVTAPYRPGEVIVGYTSSPLSMAAIAVAHVFGAAASAPANGPPRPPQVLRLPRGVSVFQAIAHLTSQPGVAYAVPDYLAHVAGGTPGPWTPDDPGRAGRPDGWEQMQWNFLPGTGINAPAAWANLRADGHPGGSGVVVAILDTGVAYRNWRHFRTSPDFADTRFTAPHDFVARNAYPLDRQGHGTFVSGTIAESTNNGLGLTGIAYGATIMPVRVLDGGGWGDADTIARGIRYAVAHGAQVINLSLEFDPSVTAGEIPSIISALAYAHQRGVVLVGASGNESETQMAYPARAHQVISVGATTRDRCLADYSNGGHRLDLVAPGGGNDASLAADPDCHPERALPDIFQMTFGNPAHPTRFGYPDGWYGTSMAAPHAAAVAALVIASGVLGDHPTPDQVLARMEATAQPLGDGRPNAEYGYGLVDAGAATAP